MAKLTAETAVEHARDGADCMVEAKKIATKLQKNFPEHAESLGKAVAHMNEARTLLNTIEVALTPKAPR
ncbi:hypothetical protein [Pseudoduganella sp. R-34]|uniref:hypothetical protein n=1 Tax=Pseudoduganella sp. R-34 TaxID=3404062 RepID=UPI003CF350BA